MKLSWLILALRHNCVKGLRIIQMIIASMALAIQCMCIRANLTKQRHTHTEKCFRSVNRLVMTYLALNFLGISEMT
jgi:competence protein ComGC